MSSRSLPPWAPLIGIAALVLAGCISSLRQKNVPAPVSAPTVPRFGPVAVARLRDYAGTDACISCHKSEGDAHHGSPHAHAMSHVTARNQGEIFQRPSGIVDVRRGIRYSTGVQGGRCVLNADAPEHRVAAAAEWAFGSGKNGITYLGDEDGLKLELRLTYYPRAGRWAFSPGQQPRSKSGGAVMTTGLMKPAETVEGCFVCHSTVIAKQDERLMTETVMMGVNCEACHGAGAAHVAAKKAGRPDSTLTALRSLTGRQISEQLCFQCHRSPSGDDLSDPFNQSQLPRLQGLALAQSACFTRSDGKLSCLTCHDPHDQRPQTVEAYNGKCASCHGATPDQHRCPVQPKGNCISCHMPAQGVGMPFGLSYRTHWIKVWTGRN